MTKVIIIQDSSTQDHYERTLDYLHRKHHLPYCRFPEVNLSESDQSETSYNDARARQTSANAQYSGDIPLGKLVA